MTEFEKWEAKARILGILDDYVIEISAPGRIILRKYEGKSKTIIIPPVDCIGTGAFQNNRYIQEVYFNNDLFMIYGNTFATCNNLRKIEFNAKVNRISASMFLCCPNLKYVKFNDSITDIGVYSFHDCKSLEHIELPKNLTRIGTHAFSYTSISRLDIPRSVNRLGDRIVAKCSKLSEINIESDRLIQYSESFYDTPTDFKINARKCIKEQLENAVETPKISKCINYID